MHNICEVIDWGNSSQLKQIFPTIIPGIHGQTDDDLHNINFFYLSEIALKGSETYLLFSNQLLSNKQQELRCSLK